MFYIIWGLILADSKSSEMLMQNDLIALGFSSYKFKLSTEPLHSSVLNYVFVL